MVTNAIRFQRFANHRRIWEIGRFLTFFLAWSHISVATEERLVELFSISPAKTSCSCRVTASCCWSGRFRDICGCLIAISRQRQLWFLGSIDGFFYIDQPTATVINARSLYLNPHTNFVRVITMYVSSACKYCLRVLTWQSHRERTLSVRTTHFLHRECYVCPLCLCRVLPSPLK